MKTQILTAIAMLAFAANSLLCRQALQQEAIDPAGFGALRLASGAFTLGLLLLFRERRPPARPRPIPTLMLFAYVLLFSFAYVSLDAGIGALILFGAVQLTMISSSVAMGERFDTAAWLGFTLAVLGLVYLLSPGASAPPLWGSLMMAGAGVAWGVYSLLGRSSREPLRDTTSYFALATPIMALVAWWGRDALHASTEGVALALASGALASGLGYVVWFSALRGLSAGAAATVQLSVPVLAALGGVAMLGEALSWRLGLATAAVLGGIALVLSRRSVRPQSADL